MNTDKAPSGSDVSKQIVTALSVVYDLYTQLNAFLRMVVEGLESSEAQAAVFKRSMFMLIRLPKHKGIPGERCMTLSMGFFAEPGKVGGDEDEEVDNGEDNEDAGERKDHAINPDTKLLAVHIRLYEHEQEDFRPTLVAALISDITRTGKSGDNPETKFKIQRRHIYQFVRNLNTNIKPGTRLPALRIPHYAVSGRVRSAIVRDLASFDTEHALNTFVDELVRLCSDANAGPR